MLLSDNFFLNIYSFIYILFNVVCVIKVSHVFLDDILSSMLQV